MVWMAANGQKETLAVIRCSLAVKNLFSRRGAEHAEKTHIICNTVDTISLTSSQVNYIACG